MSDGESENVRVAVRVRPFNKREKAKNSTLIVEMKGPVTYLQDPSEPGEDPKKFTFDYSYWSHDGFEEKPDGYLGGTKPNYADQMTVYNDMGKGVLKNAWEGFNTSLFAYGQTGSGKSWSIVGYGANKGIVPIFCEEIFQGIDAKKQEGDTSQYEVQFSMLEIYNEKVRDLLNPSNNKGGLKVRQHPKKGFYADGLKTVAVSEYKDIEDRMEEGTKNRTVAATNMNATSSRAHTIVGVVFTQKRKNDAGEETAKTSLINLVDLAGSERADSTGATGDRLKEGAAINQSLSSLGNVIAALVDKANGKNVRVPFRDSVLTKLLKNALGGNSKTLMIAAISPADINYDETLSTLRYADRAKQIKTTAKVNEDPTEKLIRELKEENEKLMDMLKKAQNGEAVKIPSGDDDDDDDDEHKEGMTEEELAEFKKQIEEEIKAQMAETERETKEMNTDWNDRVAESKKGAKDKEAEMKERQSTPHLWNLNPDPQLTGMIVQLIKPGVVKVGNRKADPPADIALSGLNIQKQHCEISNKESKTITIKPCGEARVLVNGEPLEEEEELHHLDRVMFGASHLYVFHHPAEVSSSTVKQSDISYEMAQEEIVQNAGLDVDDSESKESMLLREDLADLMPMVNEANAISEELDRKVSFEVTVVSAKARGLPEGRPEPYVVMKDLQSGMEHLWSRSKFINRKFAMQEMFQNYEDGEDWQLPDEKDPFTEIPGAETLIGCVEVSMQSLGYVLDMREQLSITDFRGREIGYLNVEVVPLNDNGKEITEDDDIFIDNPKELEGKKLDFVVRVQSAKGIPKRFTDVYCLYNMYLEEDIRTEAKSGTRNPEFNYERRFTFEQCTPKFIKFLVEKSVIVQLWGKQVPDHKPVNKAAKQGKDTRAIMRAQTQKKNNVAADLSSVKNVTDFVTMKKRKERLENKMNQIRKLCDQKQSAGQTTVPITDVRAIVGDANGNNKPGATRPPAQGANQSERNNSNESSTCIIL